MQESTGQYITVDEMARLLEQDAAVTLIDARTAEEFARGHVPGAMNVAIADLVDFARSRGYPLNELVVTMCGSGGRGEKAAGILTAEHVGNVRALQGGLAAWSNAGFPVVGSDRQGS